MALFNDYKEPLIQRPGGNIDSNDVENGESAVVNFHASSTAKPQEPSIMFADTVKDNQSDAASINGI